NADARIAPVGERDEAPIHETASGRPYRFHECFLADLGFIEVICFPKLDQKMPPHRVHPVTPSIRRPPRSRSRCVPRCVPLLRNATRTARGRARASPLRPSGGFAFRSLRPSLPDRAIP